MQLFTMILLLVVLVCCWTIGDQGLVTKLVFTGLAFLSLGFCFIPDVGHWVAMVSQAILVLVIGGTTFGSNWLSRRR
jgi:hypothetical protein